MTTDAFEVCREILRLTDPNQEFLLEDNFDVYARRYPEPALLPEGQFEGTTSTLFVTVLVPFIVGVFKDGAKDALKEQVKDGLYRLFRRKEAARKEQLTKFRADLEKILAKTKLSAHERGCLR
jgi:hypothetical protein